MRFLIPLLLLLSMSASAQTFKKLIDEDTKKTYYKGKVNFDDLKSEKLFTWYGKHADYTPNSDVVSELSDALKNYNVKMVVFLGTWCSDSHELVPRLERVLSECHYPTDEMPMYALDLEKNSLDGVAQSYNIEYVPTIILLQDGKEMGRIIETVEESLEKDMLRIVLDYLGDQVDYNNGY